MQKIVKVEKVEIGIFVNVDIYILDRIPLHEYRNSNIRESIQDSRLWQDFLTHCMQFAAKIARL